MHIYLWICIVNYIKLQISTVFDLQHGDFNLCIQKSIASLSVQRWEKTCAIYLNYSTNSFIYKSQWTDKIIEYMKKTNYIEEKQWEHTEYTSDRDR